MTSSTTHASTALAGGVATDESTGPGARPMPAGGRAVASTPAPLLSAEQLVKEYGAFRAVDGLSLTVHPGEIYCLLGPNGAGKSTTINCFLGFTAPTGGRVLVDGLDVAAHPVETKRALAYIPEQVNLYRNLSGVENLAYFAALGGGVARTRDELAALLVSAGLQASAVGQRVGTYSKGMRQKVAVALAMARDARVLLLDEPTSGLDPKASNEFSELLGTLRARGVAILMATHDLFRARETGQRVGIMNRGRLVRELATSDVGASELEQVYLDTLHAA